MEVKNLPRRMAGSLRFSEMDSKDLGVRSTSVPGLIPFSEKPLNLSVLVSLCAKQNKKESAIVKTQRNKLQKAFVIHSRDELKC